MNTWSFYDGSGAIMPDRYSGPVEYLPANTPAGCVAIEGEHDHLLRRVALVDDGMGGEAAPVVVDRLPARPGEIAGAVWEWSDDAAGWVSVPTLEAVRSRRWEELRALRDQLEIAPLLVEGVLIDVDERSMARINLALKQAEMTPGWSKAWTLADNTVQTITGHVLEQVLLGLAERGERLHAIGRQVRARILAATTAEDVSAVAWPTQEDVHADA